MWRIKHATKKDDQGRPMYWSEDVGWTWKEQADLFLDSMRMNTPVLLMEGGVWEEEDDGTR